MNESIPIPHHEIHPDSASKNYPYGRRKDGICTLVLCESDRHLEKVVKAFPIPGAYYASRWTNFAGIRCDKAIIFTNTFSEREQMDLQRYIEQQVYSRMLPEYADEVYFV